MHKQDNTLYMHVSMHVFDLILDMVQEIILANTIANAQCTLIRFDNPALRWRPLAVSNIWRGASKDLTLHTMTA